MTFSDEERKSRKIAHLFICCTTLMADDLREVYIKYFADKEPKEFEQYLKSRSIKFDYEGQDDKPIWLICWENFKTK